METAVLPGRQAYLAPLELKLCAQKLHSSVLKQRLQAPPITVGLMQREFPPCLKYSWQPANIGPNSRKG